jgi:putative endonuclease
MIYSKDYVNIIQIIQGLQEKIMIGKIIYSEAYNSKSEAYAKEKQIKSWKNRDCIEQLIKRSSEHPD